MDFEVLFPIVLCACLAVVIFIRVMASKDHLFGRICRWYWNTSCAVSAWIPFLGMTSRLPFMGPVKNHELEVYVNEVSGIMTGMAASAIEEQARREEAERRREEAIRTEIARRGGSCTGISADGSYATYTDKYGNECRANVEFR